MCNFLFDPPVEPPNEKCAKFVLVLKVFCGFELFVAISGFATGLYNHGIFSILFMLLLFCTWRSLQHQTLTIYMYCTILMYVTDLIYVLGKIQNGGDVCPPGVMCGRFVLSIIDFVYYLSCSIVCFFIYRQFKGIAFDNDPQMRQFFAERDRNRQDRPSLNDAEQPVDSNRQLYADFAPTYGQQGTTEPLPPLRPPRSTNNIEAFKGAGVRIG